MAGAAGLWKWRGLSPLPAATEGQEAAGRDVVQGGARGTIYDRRLRPLAVSLPVGTVIARPRRLQIDGRRLARLAVLLDADPDDLRQRLASSRPVEVLARGVPGGRAAEVERLGVKGIEVVRGTVRYYPEAEDTVFCVGFTAKGRGVRGLEAQADGRWGGRFPAGAACVATVDLDLQRRVMEELAALQRGFAFRQGAVVILDAVDGGVLALAGLPAFDPNRYWRYGSEALVNPALDGPVGAEYFAPLFDGTVTARAEGWQQAGQGVFRSFAAASVRGPLPGWARDAAVGLGRRGEAAGLLDLAAGIAGLIGNGQRPVPHLMAGTWWQGRWRPWRGAAARNPAGESAVPGSEVSSLLAPDGRFGFAEVAVAASLAPGEETGGPGETAASVPERGEVVACGFLLGDRPLVAVLRLAGGRIDPQGPSALRRALRAMLTAAAIVGPVAEVQEGALVVDLAGLQQRWRRAGGKGGESGREQDLGREESGSPMPGVIGLSLRKALYALREVDCRITVRGSGRVVAQEPAPGEPLQDDGGCFLQLEMDAQVNR